MHFRLFMNFIQCCCPLFVSGRVYPSLNTSSHSLLHRVCVKIDCEPLPNTTLIAALIVVVVIVFELGRAYSLPLFCLSFVAKM